MTTYEIDITVNDDNWINNIPNIRELTEGVIKACLSKIINNIETIEISVVLADNDFVKNLNRTYRNKDKPTNVLSFPITESNDLKEQQIFVSLGDIVIAFETINSEALEQNKTVKDHFTHMLIHGCLHLIHYDHLTKNEAQEMESLEIDILKTMGIKNPYEIL